MGVWPEELIFLKEKGKQPLEWSSCTTSLWLKYKAKGSACPLSVSIELTSEPCDQLASPQLLFSPAVEAEIRVEEYFPNQFWCEYFTQFWSPYRAIQCNGLWFILIVSLGPQPSSIFPLYDVASSMHCYATRCDHLLQISSAHQLLLQGVDILSVWISPSSRPSASSANNWEYDLWSRDFAKLRKLRYNVTGMTGL